LIYKNKEKESKSAPSQNKQGGIKIALVKEKTAFPPVAKERAVYR
jgi:hypothetical protein